MHELTKKTSAILFVSVFIISGITSVSAEFTKDDNINTTDETITIERDIYRIGPNGFTRLTINLDVDKEATPDEIEEQLLNKCAKLAENDKEIKQFLNSSGLNTSLFSYIKSRGRGLHFDFKVRIPIKRYFKKYPNFPPYYRLLKIPIVYCRYPRDQRAYSTIRSDGSTNETTINGGHEVLAVGFYGYTTWIGLLAERGFILRCGFAGYAMVNVDQY